MKNKEKLTDMYHCMRQPLKIDRGNGTYFTANLGASDLLENAEIMMRMWAELLEIPREEND